MNNEQSQHPNPEVIESYKKILEEEGVRGPYYAIYGDKSVIKRERRLSKSVLKEVKNIDKKLRMNATV